MPNIYEWLNRRGIKVNDRSLIRQATCHTSYFNEHREMKGDNERLEFMGDAVLQLWTSDVLYRLDLEAPKDDRVVDYKTRLQEFIQTDTRKTVTYDLVSSSGPSNAPTFIVNVRLDDVVLGTGEGSSKKRAEQHAAKDALVKMAR